MMFVSRCNWTSEPLQSLGSAWVLAYTLQVDHVTRSQYKGHARCQLQYCHCLCLGRRESTTRKGNIVLVHTPHPHTHIDTHPHNTHPIHPHPIHTQHFNTHTPSTHNTSTPIPTRWCTLVEGRRWEKLIYAEQTSDHVSKETSQARPWYTYNW